MQKTQSAIVHWIPFHLFALECRFTIDQLTRTTFWSFCG